MKYWAVMPASSGPPSWKLDNCRIEKTATAREACDLAFGRTSLKPEYNRGIWLAKSLGHRISAIQSTKQRIAMLTERKGWFDPWGEP